MIRETQRAAYEDLQASVGDKQKTVLNAIRSLDGATLFEIVKHLGWPVNSISGRVRELFKMGLIEDSGQRRINPASGKRGILWILVKRKDPGQMNLL